MSKQLRKLTTSVKSVIKDSKSFAENIKDEKLSDNRQFVIFDIKIMYPSSPKYDVLSEIKNRINNNNIVTSTDKCALIELAILSLEFLSFTIDQKYYNRKQCSFIGCTNFITCFRNLYSKSGKNHIYTMLSAPYR